MRVLMRTTATGREYWDTKEKRTLFVPVGKEPEFEVTKNPDSMIYGVDLASGEDLTVVNGEIINQPLEVNDGKNDFELNKMTLKELRALAADNDIDIPADVKKKEEISQFIFDNWLQDDEE